MTRPHLVPPRESERGMILINVLVIVMLATSVLALMLAGDDADVERSTSLRSASQAMAYARGGELTAVAALRRDLAAGGPSDALDDGWAKIGDNAAPIAGGRFTLAVIDAQAKFNLNSLTGGGILAGASLEQIVHAAGLPADIAKQIGQGIQLTGPIGDLADLEKVGFTPAQVAQLARFCTVLPTPTVVNLNTADEALIAILTGNPTAARTLVQARMRAGHLTPADLSAVSILLPPGTGLRSDYFWVRARVTNGRTRQQLTSLLYRRMGEKGPEVLAVRRWRGPPPLQAPALSEPLPAAEK
ncbi:MAG: Type II secretory pathway component PulK-like protein [Croceibacterium sp.]